MPGGLLRVGSGRPHSSGCSKEHREDGEQGTAEDRCLDGAEGDGCFGGTVGMTG